MFLKRKLPLVALLASVSMAGPILTACSSNSGDGKEAVTSENKSSATRTITDCLGREVQVPEKVNSVIGLNNGLRYLVYLNCVDKVVGVEVGEKETATESINVVKAYGYLNKDKFKDLPAVGEGGSGGYTPYTEEIINVAPDVIIAGYSAEDADDLQKKTGIPVIAINSGTLFGEDYDQSLQVIGKVMGVEDRAKEIEDYIDNVEKDVETRVKDVKESDKPSVYTGAVSFKGGHGIEGTYSNFPIFTIMKANDVTKGISDQIGGTTIDKEKVLEWNPDYIFLDPNNMSYVNEDYKANSNYYKQLKAVNDGNIYSCVGYNWYHTNVEIALADTYYVASKIYPTQFKDVNPEEKAKEIFKTFLNSDTYYDELEASGKGFGQLKIGE